MAKKQQSISKQLTKIEKEVKQIAEDMTKEIAKQVRKDFNDARKQILESFYSYEPSSDNYERTDSLTRAIYVTENKGRATARFIVNGAKMNSSYGNSNSSSVSGDYVLDLIWNQGIRGLPQSGSNDISETYTFNGNTFEAGHPWENPFWNQETYENEFRTKIYIGNFTSNLNTPDRVMTQFVNHWGDKRGIDVADKARQIIKQKYK